MIILYTSISIVVLAFILCLIIQLNNNRKENINIIKDYEKEFMERAEKFEELKKHLGITQ